MVEEQEQLLSPPSPSSESEGTPAPAGEQSPASQNPVPAGSEITPPAEDPEAPPAPPVPGTVVMNEFQNRTVKELYDLGSSLGLRVGGVRSKHQLVFEILCHYGRQGSVIEATGILEITREGFGILRNPKYSFAPFPDDIFLAPSV